MEKEKVRDLLPLATQKLFDDISYSRVLGATRHTDMIGQMISSVIESNADHPQKAFDAVIAVSEYFKGTRGTQSRAIYNGINLMVPRPAPEVEAQAFLIDVQNRIKSYKTQAADEIQKIVAYSKALFESMQAVMVFDFSRTVAAVLAALPPSVTVFIPESRALDGGKPFVPYARKAGVKTHFIPDTAIMHCLRDCQAALTGAESFYPDGTLFNTIGTDLVAVACSYLNVPLYALTPLLKVDVRPVYGYIRSSPMPFDFVDRLAGHWSPEEREGVDYNGVKLLSVPPHLVHAYITEQGIIPTSGLFPIAMRYNERLEGQNV